jgi:hypothetical protein
MNAVWMPMIMLANPMMQVDSTLMNERVEDVAFVDQESEKETKNYQIVHIRLKTMGIHPKHKLIYSVPVICWINPH